jgi:hypothetical protein
MKILYRWKKYPALQVRDVLEKLEAEDGNSLRSSTVSGTV